MTIMNWLRAEWDRVLGFSLVGLGAVFLLLGYHGVRQSPFLAEQLAYIASGGLGGLFCLGLGVGLFLSADLHDEWRKLDRIEAALRGRPLPDIDEVITEINRSRHEPPTTGGSPPVVLGSGPKATNGAHAVALDWVGSGLRRSLAIATAVLALPATGLTLGWRQAHQTAELDRAAHGLGIAVLALFAAFAVIALYGLSVRTRLTRRKLDFFAAELTLDRLANARLHQPGGGGAIPAPGGDDIVVFAPGLSFYHRPGCRMVAGLEVRSAQRATVDPSLTGCEICTRP